MNKSEIKSRRISWEIIKKSISKNKRLSDVTLDYFKKESISLSNDDKKFITMLVQGTVRLSGRLDLEIKDVFKGDYADLRDNLKILLRLGVYQIHYMDSVPDYAAVATTVQLAKRIHSNLGGLANAILRTIIKKESKIKLKKDASISNISEFYSHPEWLIKKWIKDLTLEDAKSLADWNNQPPQIWFRINSICYTSDLFKKYLKENNIDYIQNKFIKDFFNINNTQELIKNDLFINGNISIQDPSAGLVVHLLNPKKGEVITDLCAAPGGKTSYIAEKLNNTGTINAYDISKHRLTKLKETVNRLKLTNVNIKHLDITKEKIDMSDKILIDAPCTGTGVLSKKPDIKWRRTIDEILEMHLLQRKILWNAANYVNPNGVIIYSTCSLEFEENYMVINAFLKSHSQFKLENASSYIPKEFVDENGVMQTFPTKHKIDGGFAFRLRKNA